MVHIDGPSLSVTSQGPRFQGVVRQQALPVLSDTVSNQVFYIRVGVAKLHVGISGAHCSLNRAP